MAPNLNQILRDRGVVVPALEAPTSFATLHERLADLLNRSPAALNQLAQHPDGRFLEPSVESSIATWRQNPSALEAAIVAVIASPRSRECWPAISEAAGRGAYVPDTLRWLLSKADRSLCFAVVESMERSLSALLPAGTVESRLHDCMTSLRRRIEVDAGFFRSLKSQDVPRIGRTFGLLFCRMRDADVIDFVSTLRQHNYAGVGTEALSFLLKASWPRLGELLSLTSLAAADQANVSAAGLQHRARDTVASLLLAVVANLTTPIRSHAFRLAVIQLTQAQVAALARNVSSDVLGSLLAAAREEDRPVMARCFIGGLIDGAAQDPRFQNPVIALITLQKMLSNLSQYERNTAIAELWRCWPKGRSMIKDAVESVLQNEWRDVHATRHAACVRLDLFEMSKASVLRRDPEVIKLLQILGPRAMQAIVESNTDPEEVLCELLRFGNEAVDLQRAFLGSPRLDCDRLVAQLKAFATRTTQDFVGMQQMVGRALILADPDRANALLEALLSPGQMPYIRDWLKEPLGPDLARLAALRSVERTEADTRSIDATHRG